MLKTLLYSQVITGLDKVICSVQELQCTGTHKVTAQSLDSCHLKALLADPDAYNPPILDLDPDTSKSKSIHIHIFRKYPCSLYGSSSESHGTMVRRRARRLNY